MSVSLQRSVSIDDRDVSARSFSVGDAALWWHYRSLDAPTVAATWTWFAGRTAHVVLPWTSFVAIFLGVWIVYACDRLLDGISGDGLRRGPPELEARHVFHAAHRTAFLVGIALALAVLLSLLLGMPSTTRKLYAVLGIFQLAWFLIVHLFVRNHPGRIPKELAVGVFFAAAVFIPTVSRLPSLGVFLLPWAIGFACLCSLNCLFIFAWEHDSRYSSAAMHATTRVALCHLKPIAYCFILAVVLLAVSTNLMPPSFAAAVTLAAALLLVLDRLSHALGPLRLRSLADLVLLTPLVIVALLQ